MSSMTITEILQITDRLILSQTGKHLNHLQETVIKGAWQGQTYQVIAEECQHSESRIRDVGYELWNLLSKALGEDIKKNNFRSTFEKLNIDNGGSLLRIPRANVTLNYNFSSSSGDKKSKANEQNLQNGGAGDDLFGVGVDLSDSRQSLFQKEEGEKENSLK